MPRTYSSIDKIRAEPAWVTETPDPNKWAVAMFCVGEAIVRWSCNRNNKDVHHAFGLECEEFNLAWQRM
jgi:hypothetical protein